MKRILLCFSAFLAVLTASVVQGAIPVGTVQTFATQPAATEWSTITNGGVTATFPDLATLEPAIQTNVASAISFELFRIANDATGAAARYQSNATVQRILTRPTGIGYASVLATVQNTTGTDLDSVTVSYDLGNPTPLPNSEDPGLAGLLVYYSLTGLGNDWTAVPGLSSGTAGGLIATLTLGSWPANALLYLLFIDDNGGPAGDGSYSIDNLLVATSIAPPIITQDPVNTTNLVSRSVSLSVTATGVGLQYSWFKDGVGIDPGVNPSAATATFTIAAGAVSDSGNYHVVVSNPGGQDTSAIARLQINPDTFAPRFLSAQFGAGLNVFRLIVDEPLCEDPTVCGALSQDNFNWQVQDTATLTDLGVFGVVITGGTNVDITTIEARTPGVTYRIIMVEEQPNGGVADLFGNFVPRFTFVETLPTASFQQGVGGYTGTQDTFVHGDAPDAVEGAQTYIEADQENPGAGPNDISHGLMRFDNIFGSAPGQVPFGASIISATLSLQHTRDDADGSAVNLHSMLVPWDQTTATWTTLVDGVQANGTDAKANVEVQIISNFAEPFTVNVNVTASVQAWANGEANNGWAFINTDTGGYRPDSSESASPPSLSIIYQVLPCNTGPSFTSHPVSTTGIEGGNVTFNAGVMSCGTTTFQWTKNNVDIVGQTSSSLSLANLTVADAGQYRLRVTNPNGTATSNPATLTINPDTTRPVVTSVVGVNQTTIVVTFSKVMGPSATVVAGHYILSPSGSVTGASLSADGRTVTLTTTARNFTTAYSLRIQDVADNRNTPNVINPNPTIVSPTTVQPVAGLADSWTYSTNSQDATLTSGTPWFAPGFVTGAEWLTGAGLFGFDDTPATIAALPAPILTPLIPNTAANSGADGNLFVTTYFRRSVTLPALPAGGQYVLCTIADDGFILYVDGAPVMTNNMPNVSPITFTNRAVAAAAEGVVECVPFNITPGTHDLALELHQAGTTSSDVIFGLDIRILSTVGPSLSISSASGTATVSWSADSSWELTGAADVAGPYTTQAGTAVSPFSFTLPVTSTNHFYRLRYSP